MHSNINKGGQLKARIKKIYKTKVAQNLILPLKHLKKLKFGHLGPQLEKWPFMASENPKKASGGQMKA